MEAVEQVQMNIYQSNYLQKRNKLATFRRWAKGLRQAAREGTTALHTRFCNISNNSKKQLRAPANTRQQYSMYGRMAEIQSNFWRNATLLPTLQDYVIMFKNYWIKDWTFWLLIGHERKLRKIPVSLPHSCDGLKILICYHLLPSDRV